MILIIDTSSKKSLVSLISRNNIKKEIWESNFNHSEKLLPRIKKLLGYSGLKKLKSVGVVFGPGSYTGLRVGTATANALSYALQVPLIGINKFEWLANLASMGSLLDIKDLQICAMVPAIHDQVFFGFYMVNRNSSGKLRKPKEFKTGNIKKIYTLVNKPTVFSVENVNGVKDIIDEKDLENNIKNNFSGIEYYKLYDKASIEVLTGIVKEKIKKKEYKNIIHPLYINKPNIT